MRAPVVPEISAVQLKSDLSSDNPPVVLDVREPEERDIAVISDDIHIPLMELSSRISECQSALQNEQELVVYCRSGARSAFAVELLRESGLKQAKNLSGGILAWSSDVDSRVTRY